MGQSATTTADAALSDEWLSRTNGVETFYAGLRDRFEPGKPLWITETADAACGGNPWASTFLDSFRYLSQLGSMAQRGVQVVTHNTLDASDYGLLDENTLVPRPNYWSALLWRKVMGTTAMSSERFTLTAKSLSSTHVQLNGKQLDLGADDVLPPLHGVQVPSGTTIFAPASITRFPLKSFERNTTRIILGCGNCGSNLLPSRSTQSLSE